MLRKKADPKRFSSIAKAYIKKHNPGKEVVQSLSKLLSDQDIHDIRGSVHGSKFGV
jgi:predicted DNA-binding protein with PD1-like motif